MENFYVFLDLDGTLWDRKFIGDKTNGMLVSNDFCPESVLALNTLIEELRIRKYNPNIVLMSRRRVDLDGCIEIMQANNIREDLPIHSLSFDDDLTRGERISLFLRDRDKNKPFDPFKRKCLFYKHHLNYASKKDNYVAIDDAHQQFLNIPTPHYIKTNIKDGHFSMDMLKNFLSAFDKKRNSDSEPEA